MRTTGASSSRAIVSRTKTAWPETVRNAECRVADASIVGPCHFKPSRPKVGGAERVRGKDCARRRGRGRKGKGDNGGWDYRMTG